MTRWPSAVRPDVHAFGTGSEPDSRHGSVPESAADGAAAQLTTAELVRLASEQLSRLVHDEIRLARAELRQKGRRAVVGIALLAVAVLLASYGLGVLLVAGVLALAEVLPMWLAALLVGLALVALAALAAWTGRRRLHAGSPPYPQQAVASVRADARMLAAKARR